MVRWLLQNSAARSTNGHGWYRDLQKVVLSPVGKPNLGASGPIRDLRLSSATATAPFRADLLKLRS